MDPKTKMNNMDNCKGGSCAIRRPNFVKENVQNNNSTNSAKKQNAKRAWDTSYAVVSDPQWSPFG